MTSFFVQNKSLLTFYRKLARSVGWVLLAGGLIWFLVFIFWILAVKDAAGDLSLPGLHANMLYAIMSFLNDFALPGLIALVLSRLLQFIMVSDDKGGWILQQGHWILYGFAIVIVGEVILKMSLMPETLDPDSLGLVFVSPLLVPMLARILILVGLGQILRRIIPVIEESKTLV